MSNDKIHQAISDTLFYAGIFHYPLTADEIWQFLIWENKISPPVKSDFEKVLKNSPFPFKNGFYYLSDTKIINHRLQKEKFSTEKINIAKNAADILKKIPTVKLIGISGALAMDNAKADDDIDFFLICQKNTLWITRFLATLFLDLKNLRRKPHNKNITDKICLNMYLDENCLTLPIFKQNLYTAHEVGQLKIIYDAGGYHQRFLSANNWVLSFLPNVFPKQNKFILGKSSFLNRLLNLFFPIINYLFMLPQVWFMRSRRTFEIVNFQSIFFHPRDLTSKVLSAYQNKIS